MNYANPSIKLRIKKEILQDITGKEEQEWKEQILEEKIIKFMSEKQQPNGWIGLGFHGSNKNAGQYDNQETATKYMGEKGLKGTELLDRAIHAFETTKLTDLCYETKGHYYDEFKIPAFGQNMIRCACIARAHYDDIIDIKPQVGIALESFKRVTEVDSILDVSRAAKKCRLFNDYERWPCRYHLEILAFTQEKWKNKENIAVLAEAFQRLMRADREEIMNTPVACWVGHAVGPLWYLAEGYTISSDEMDRDGVKKKHIIDLEKVEWLVRCGLYDSLPKLKAEVDFIMDHVGMDGICNVDVHENAFKGWSPYSGLSLETDWKSKKRKNCDLTFRALLIAHYAGIF